MARKVLSLACVFLLLGGPVRGQTPPTPPPSGGAEGAGGPPPILAPGSESNEAAQAFGAVGSCSTGYRLGVSAEGLLWRLQGAHLPPLLTTSPAGTPAGQAGVLGEPGTTILFGESSTDENLRGGGRLSFGVWLDEQRPLGLEGSFFFLADHRADFAASSNGSTILARPFFDTDRQLLDAELIAFPSGLAGTFRVTTISRLLGAEIYVRENLVCRGGFRLDALVGYRFLYLRESLDINHDLTNTDATGLTTRVGVADNFATDNNFNGGEVGLIAQLRRGGLEVDLLAKLAVGGNHRSTDIAGVTSIGNLGQTPTAFVGGLLAQQTNIGHRAGSECSLVPEFGVNLRYALTSWLHLSAGYTFLYWTRVIRPGDQIDFAVNRTGIPPGTLTGDPRPTPVLQPTDVWVQGVSLGLECRY